MNKVQANFLEQIEENESQLTDWERKFVDDLTKRDPDSLTVIQNHKLNEIYNRVVFA